MNTFPDIKLRNIRADLSVRRDILSERKLTVTQASGDSLGGRHFSDLELDYDSAEWLHDALELALGGVHDD